MVVILCEDYRDAEAAFRAWIAFLQAPPSDEIASIDKYSLRVETSDGLCYLFTDYRFEKVFAQKPDIIFESVGDFLDWNWLEDHDPYRREYRRKVEEDES